jgi:hypothetical protein
MVKIFVKLWATISRIFKRSRGKKTANIFARTKLLSPSTLHIWKQPTGMCLLCEVVSTVDSVLVVQCEWYAAHIHVTHLQ